MTGETQTKELAGFSTRMEKAEEASRQQYEAFTAYDVEDVSRAVYRLTDDDQSLFLYLVPEEFAADILEGMGLTKQRKMVKVFADVRYDPDYADRVYKEVAEEIRYVPGPHVDGMQKIANILSHTQPSTHRNILEGLEEEDPEYVEQIRSVKKDLKEEE